MENPISKWMITRGTSIYGNSHMNSISFFQWHQKPDHVHPFSPNTCTPKLRNLRSYSCCLRRFESQPWKTAGNLIWANYKNSLTSDRAMYIDIDIRYSCKYRYRYRSIYSIPIFVNWDNPPESEALFQASVLRSKRENLSGSVAPRVQPIGSPPVFRAP